MHTMFNICAYIHIKIICGDLEMHDTIHDVNFCYTAPWWLYTHHGSSGRSGYEGGAATPIQDH